MEHNRIMRRQLQITVSASAAAYFLAFSALAQDTLDPKSAGPDNARIRMRHASRRDQLNGAAKASDVIGILVSNYQNETLGTVQDIAVDVETGRILQVILLTGEVVGVGDTLRAVPPEALHHDVVGKVLHLDVDKQKLETAPTFKMSKWAECSDSDHLSGVYGYYGEEAALNFIQRGDAVLDEHRNKEAAPNTASTREATDTWENDRISVESRSMIPILRLSQVQKASQVIGTPVRNQQEEKLGKVQNLLVDLGSGRIVAIVVTTGEYLGIADELSVVPPTALRFTADRDALQIDASKDMLSHAPHFRADQWPDLSQPSYADGVYRTYKVEPYFTTNLTTELNTATSTTNDGNNSTAKPLDQGKSKSDLVTTAQIRKEIMAEKSISMNAKNVKIVTIDGRVTLRGPVKSDDEKRLIGAIAERIARFENVDNQLEVDITTTSNN